MGISQASFKNKHYMIADEMMSSFSLDEICVDQSPARALCAQYVYGETAESFDKQVREMRTNAI